MRKVLFFFFIGLLSLAHESLLCAQDIYITSLDSLIERMKEPNLSLYICSQIDLEGKTLQLPLGTTLLFRDGKLYNGTLIGDKTKILPDRSSCLGMILKGAWISPSIDDSWFDEQYLDDNVIMSNINTLQSDEVVNTIHLYRDYMIDIDSMSYSAIVLKSNTALHIHSVIRIKPNSYAKYGIIDITNKHNVSVEGGKVMGDVGKHKYISNTTSEWGMGINIIASQNVSISDLTVSLCTGDGIYLGGYREEKFNVFDNACKSIYINNVICDKNRRQGLSIVHAKDVTIRNCQFSNTGFVEFTNPGHGIDIEPNISNNRNMSVSDISIIGCSFINNKGKDVSTAHYYCSETEGNIKNIIINNSFFDSEITIRSGSFLIDSVFVPKISVYVSKYDMGDIAIENSTIYAGIYLHSSVADQQHPEYTGFLNNFILSNCHFTNRVKNKGKYVLALSGDMNRIRNLEFNNCDFNYNIGNKQLINRNQKGFCVFNNCMFSGKLK